MNGCLVEERAYTTRMKSILYLLAQLFLGLEEMFIVCPRKMCSCFTITLSVKLLRTLHPSTVDTLNGCRDTNCHVTSSHFSRHDIIYSLKSQCDLCHVNVEILNLADANCMKCLCAQSLSCNHSLREASLYCASNEFLLSASVCLMATHASSGVRYFP